MGSCFSKGNLIAEQKKAESLLEAIIHNASSKNFNFGKD